MDNTTLTVTQNTSSKNGKRSGTSLRKTIQTQRCKSTIVLDTKLEGLLVILRRLHNNNAIREQWRWSLIVGSSVLVLLLFQMTSWLSTSPDLFHTAFNVLKIAVQGLIGWSLIICVIIHTLAGITGSCSLLSLQKLTTSRFRQRPGVNSKNYRSAHASAHGSCKKDGALQTSAYLPQETYLYTTGAAGQTKVAIQKHEPPEPLCNGFRCLFYAHNPERYKSCMWACYRPGGNPKAFSDWLRHTLENHWHWGDCLEERISGQTWRRACEAKVDGRSTRGRSMSQEQREQLTYHNVYKILFGGMAPPSSGCPSSSNHEIKPPPHTPYHPDCHELPPKKTSDSSLLQTRSLAIEKVVSSPCLEQSHPRVQRPVYSNNHSNYNTSSSPYMQLDGDFEQSRESMKVSLQNLVKEIVFNLPSAMTRLSDQEDDGEARNDIAMWIEKLTNLQAEFMKGKQKVGKYVPPPWVSEQSPQNNSGCYVMATSMQSGDLQNQLSSISNPSSSNHFLPDLSAPQHTGQIFSTGQDMFISQSQIRDVADPPYNPHSSTARYASSGFPRIELDVTAQGNTGQYLQLPLTRPRASSNSSFTTAPEQPNLSAYSGSSPFPYSRDSGDHPNSTPNLEFLDHVQIEESFDDFIEGYSTSGSHDPYDVEFDEHGQPHVF